MGISPAARSCDPLSNEPKCAYDPNFVSHHSAECSISDAQSQRCLDKCRPVTPNGCDCFGCCQVPGVAHPIRLDSTCETTADFADPNKCPACTQVTQCMNTCGHCQLCLGKTTLPPDCAPAASDGGTAGDGGPGSDAGPPVPQCDPGIQPCGPDFPGCPESAACITGCCIPLP